MSVIDIALECMLCVTTVNKINLPFPRLNYTKASTHQLLVYVNPTKGR